jgi:hypothetical protein
MQDKIHTGQRLKRSGKGPFLFILKSGILCIKEALSWDKIPSSLRDFFKGVFPWGGKISWDKVFISFMINIYILIDLL